MHVLEGDAVVVHPGSDDPAGCWPAVRFAAVARWAAERGHRVVVIASASQRSIAETVRRGAGLGPEVVRTGDLDELAAVVAGACLVVTCDPGIAGLAAAHATPWTTSLDPTTSAPGRVGLDAVVAEVEAIILGARAGAVSACA